MRASILTILFHGAARCSCTLMGNGQFDGRRQRDWRWAVGCRLCSGHSPCRQVRLHQGVDHSVHRSIRLHNILQ